MKNYELTNRGKILLTTYFIAVILSYFFSTGIFYFLTTVVFILIGLEIINGLVNYFKKRTDQKTVSSNEAVVEAKVENFDVDMKEKDEVQEKPKEAIVKVVKDNSVEESSPSKNDVIADEFESIEEDLQSMEKDLEAIGKKVSDYKKESIENYFTEKKKDIADDLTKNNEVTQMIEEKSLIDTFIEWLKDFLSFKKYKKGNLVLHNHFGIGKIIATEETLKVSFINNYLEEIIEFEYDKNNKIPELNLFKAPNGEDERQYYYNYKRDITEELSNAIEKIHLNLPDVKSQWNVFLKSGDRFEKHEFIAISDQVHVFSKKQRDSITCQLLEKLLEDIDLKIKKHEISDYTAINSILLKGKVKGNMSLDIVNTINQRIEEANIKDFNERMQYIK